MKFRKKDITTKTPDEQKQKKLRNRVAMRHGVYATVITALVLVGAVVINILSNAIAQRFHTTIDLTAERSNTISPSNVSYIRDVDKDVTVTICASEDGYTGDYMAYYAYNYYSAQDVTGQYYRQTITLIEDYAVYNNHIKIVYADPQEPSFAEVQSRFSNTNLYYGDIIVECSFELNGKTINRNKILTYENLYQLEDTSGYAEYGMDVYTVTGSNVETALTSAIYYVTSEESTQALILGNHSNTSLTEQLVENLELNNYVVNTTSEAMITSIPEETDLLLIVAPTSDFATEELEVIETFLENGNDRGKGLLYFASTASPELPRLNTFLEDWGITVESGILYETDERYQLNQSPTSMGVFNQLTEYTPDVNNQSVVFAGSNLVPMRTAYERYDSRVTSSLMETSASVVVAPVGTDQNFTPSDSLVQSAYPVAILTRDTSYENDSNGLSSYVVAFASTDFILGTWDDYTIVDNMSFVIAAANQASGVGDSNISFSTKVVATGAFNESPSTQKINTVRILFVFIIPIIALVLCFVIWIRRKNK